ncbi:MAG: DUF58 domain-containing protein [Candidatus Caldarchaeum sp.]
MLTREGYGLALTAFILTALTSTVVVYHPLTLSLFAATIFSLAYILLTTRSLKSLKPTDFTFVRTINNQDPKPGEVIEVRVVVVNKTGRELVLTVFDGFEGLTLVRGSMMAEKQVKHGDGVEIQYAVAAEERGVYYLGPLTVKVADDYGLCCRFITLEREARVFVRPRMTERTKMVDSVRRAQTLFISGSGFSMRFGADDLFREISRAEEGQDLKNIDWRRTAREDGEIYVRKYDKLNRLRIAFLIDCTASNSVGKPSLMDLCMSSVASSALSMLEKGDAVVVKPLGAAEPSVFNALSTADFERLAVFLTRLKPGLGFDLMEEVRSLDRFDVVFLIGRLASVDGNGVRLVEDEVRRRKGVLFTIIPVLAGGGDFMQTLNRLEMLRVENLKTQAKFVYVVDAANLPQYIAHLHRMLRAAT